MRVLTPPPQDEQELLIREARARQRKRRLVGAAALIAFLAGTGLAIHSIASGKGSRVSAGARRGVPAATTRSRCGVRIEGTTEVVGQGGDVVYRDPYQGSMWHDLRCQGTTVWAVFVNGIGTNVESYLGVRSLDGGRTWRVAFAQDPRVRKQYSVGAELGPWALQGRRSAYFVGTCGPCSVGKAYGTVSLTVTKDAGRTFRHHLVRALTGWTPRRIRATGHEVAIWASQLVRKRDTPPVEVYRHRVVRLPVE